MEKQARNTKMKKTYTFYTIIFIVFYGTHDNIMTQI